MAEFKLVIGDPKTGKSIQKEVKAQEAGIFLNKKIKDTIKGESIGHQGYEFEITGGSDRCGFPMRYDVMGASRKRVLATGGVGIKKKDKGTRQRKTVCGNTINENITQINLKVTKHGKAPLAEEAKEEAKEKPEEKKKEETAEEKKEETEKKPEEEKKEKATEEKKEESKEKPEEKKEESKK